MNTYLWKVPLTKDYEKTSFSTSSISNDNLPPSRLARKQTRNFGVSGNLPAFSQSLQRRLASDKVNEKYLGSRTVEFVLLSSPLTWLFGYSNIYYTLVILMIKIKTI